MRVLSPLIGRNFEHTFRQQFAISKSVPVISKFHHTLYVKHLYRTDLLLLLRSNIGLSRIWQICQFSVVSSDRRFQRNHEGTLPTRCHHIRHKI